MIVGETALEVGLEAERAGDHVPGAVLPLRAEEVVDAAAVEAWDDIMPDSCSAQRASPVA